MLVLAVAVDQAAKYASTSPFRNYNFAFSLPLPLWLMYSIYSLALIFIFNYLAFHIFTLRRLQQLAWMLILAGALSNIGERIALGYVRDFIYILGGVFNLADGFIILGIIILLSTKGSSSSSFEE